MELANTDDDLMTEVAEAILMGSAFDQLLPGKSTAYNLAKRFGQLFHQFGNVTVADAIKSRPGIEIDPDYAADQLKWCVHRKWLEELYQVRSKAVHHGKHDARKWGWAIPEHLVMAAHVLPRVVKLMLEKEGHYALTDDDHAGCLAVDALLAADRWVHDDEAQEGKSWQSIVSDATFTMRIEAAMKAYMQKHPDAFKNAAIKNDAEPGVTTGPVETKLCPMCQSEMKFEQRERPEQPMFIGLDQWVCTNEGCGTVTCG